MAIPTNDKDRTYAVPLRLQPVSSSPYNFVGSPLESALLRRSPNSKQIGNVKCPSDDSYSLEELTNMGGLCPEEVAHDWIKALLTKKQKQEYLLQKSHEIPLLKEFRPLLVGSRNRPDVVVCTRESLIQMVVAIESKSNYNYTLQETVLSMIDRLCILRCFDDTISSCIGFTFPTLGRKFSVAKIHLQYKDFVFEYSLQLLPKDDVAQEIKSVLSVQLAKYNAGFYPYLIRLSREELDRFEVGAAQVQTKASLLIRSRDGRTYWKYIPHPTSFFALVARGEELLHSLLPKMKTVRVGKLSFFVYEGLSPPLSREDAQLRLCSLLPMLKEALDELHSNNIAHMDIRLENICFKHGHEHCIQLIDLDRCLGAHRTVGVLPQTDMYNVPEDWQNYQIDYRAVGMMVCYILSKPEDITAGDYHTMVSNRKVDHWMKEHSFIKSLLERGEWNEDYYKEFDSFLHSAGSHCRRC